MEKQFTSTVHVEGVDALLAGFNRVDKGLARELQKRLREIGVMIADEAKGIAEYRGYRGEGDPYDKHPGQLIARIQPSVRRGSVYVRDSARTVSAKYPGGYNYPARLEYQDGSSGSFMRDALKGRREDVVREFDKLLDWVAYEWGKT